MFRVGVISYHTCPYNYEGQDRGGMDTYINELYNALSSTNLKVDIFTRQHTSQNTISNIHKHIRLIHLPAGPLESLIVEESVVFVDEFVNQLKEYIQNQKIQYDLFHCHYYLSGLIAVKVNLLMNKNLPIIMSFHSLGKVKDQVTGHLGEKSTQKRILAEENLTHLAKMITANCEMDSNHLRTLYLAPKEKILVIRPGVNTDIFKPKPPKITEHLQLMRLIFVGRTKKIKGLENLLEAFRLLNDLNPYFFRLQIVGSDILYIQKLVTSLGISSLVELTPQCGHKKLSYYYQNSDLLVLPSYYDSYGMVALEALASGTPALVTRQCGVAHLIASYNKAWVSDSNDPSILADSIMNIVTQPHLLHFSSNPNDLSWTYPAEMIKKRYQDILQSD